MSADGPTAWLARTGERGFALTDCVNNGVVALRYAGVGDAQPLTVPEIAAAVETTGARTNVTMVAGTLARFVHDVEVGDVIVATHLETRSVYFGQVTGDYRFEDPSPVPDFMHLRPVEWFGTLDRDTDVPAARRSDIGKQPTIYALADQEYWLERAEAARESTEAVRAPRRAAGPKVPNTGPVAQETPTQVCTSCGLRKAIGIMTDGICRDCLA